MKLLEVVRGAKTGKDVLATVMTLVEEDQEGRRGVGRLRRLHRQPDARAVHPAGDVPARGGRDAAAGRPGAREVRAWRWARSGWATWPATTSAGTSASAATSRSRTCSTRGSPTSMCELGRFGQKTGAGWYRYEAGKRDAIPDPAVEELIVEYRAELGVDAAEDLRRGDRRAAASSRWSTRARRSSRRASRCGRPTSTSSTSPATASRATAAGRCSTPTLCGLYNVATRDEPLRREPAGRSVRSGSPRRSLAKLAAEGEVLQPNRRRPAMSDAVIVSTARTGLAKSWRGALNMTHGATMGGHVVEAAVARARIEPGEVEDVRHGLRAARGRDRREHRAPDRAAGRLPVTTSGTTVNRFCSSGLQTIAMAAQRVIADEADGVSWRAASSRSRACRTSGTGTWSKDPWLVQHKPEIYWPHAADRRDRGEALRDPARAAGRVRGAEPAARRGRARGGPLRRRDRPDRRRSWASPTRTTGRLVTREVTLSDRRGRSARTRPTRASPGSSRRSRAGSIAAGNASQFSDGASACVVMDAKLAEKRGLQPLGIFRGFAVAGCEPDEMGIGPVFAVPQPARARRAQGRATSGSGS